MSASNSVQPSPEKEEEFSAATKRPCPVCGEDIQKSARKCIHCDAILDWRKYISLSNTTLALLTALLSVSVTSFPIIKSAIEPKESSLRGVYVAHNNGGNRGNISLLISNEGHRTGAISGGSLHVKFKNSSNDEDVSFELEPISHAPEFVKPDTTIPVFLTFTGDLMSNNMANELKTLQSAIRSGKIDELIKSNNESCFLQLDFSESSGLLDLGGFYAFCPDFYDAISKIKLVPMRQDALPNGKTSLTFRTSLKWLGLQVQEITPDLVEIMHLPTADGMLVAGIVQASPAALAQVRTGDVIINLNNIGVSDMPSLLNIIAVLPSGQNIPVVLWRDGGQVTLQLLTPKFP